MDAIQKRILWTAAVFSFVFNAFCLGFSYWGDWEMEKAGISIESILSDKR